jgi:hypothetical protein
LEKKNKQTVFARCISNGHGKNKTVSPAELAAGKKKEKNVTESAAMLQISPF